ncbi:hypothetical protein N7478_004217 [Penicillium angulare]|uniref:uncharacterized protein n=1 Tax=Penicillium angulare TaxID=116970 RepID=UPI002541D777|nr:uncharacterized protein N7478_004217 [Penicillium angulare]KAJ5278845.1 hypothetical protein N7478_004217 [Penicillium angulare]
MELNHISVFARKIAVFEWNTIVGHLQHADIVTDKLNLYGCVSKARLVISAKAFKLPVDETGKARVTTEGLESLGMSKFLVYCLQKASTSPTYTWIGTTNLAFMMRLDIPEARSVNYRWTTLDQPFMLRSYNIDDQEVMLGILVRPVMGTEGEYERIGLWYSENKGLGGKKFWDNIAPRNLILV